MVEGVMILTNREVIKVIPNIAHKVAINRIHMIEDHIGIMIDDMILIVGIRMMIEIDIEIHTIIHDRRMIHDLHMIATEKGIIIFYK